MPVDLDAARSEDAAARSRLCRAAAVAAIGLRCRPATASLPKFALRQFTPPVAVFNNLNPKLAMEPTLIGDPRTSACRMSTIR